MRLEECVNRIFLKLNFNLMNMPLEEFTQKKNVFK